MPAPAPHSDAMILRLEGEMAERNQLIQGIAQDAQAAGRDLNESELEQISRARSRISELATQIEPLREASRIAVESRQRAELVQAEIARLHGSRSPDGRIVEYRSFGEYVADLYPASRGDLEAQERLDTFNRAAAHQTTSDNPGLLPQRIVEPVLNYVDEARPLVSAIGPQNLGEGSWAYARVTQHTLVGQQSAEKAELPSRNMQVTLTSITAPTFGGYVNISKQNIRRANPGIVDMVINDLAGQYAIETEDECADDLLAAATEATLKIPVTASLTPLSITQAVYGALGQSVKGLRAKSIPAVGPIVAVSPDRLGLIAPMFPSINPQNAYGAGFTAEGLNVMGPQGAIAGVTVVMSPGLADGTVLAFYRSAVRVFEDRYGALQVNEPSVMGVQVGYAGDFETVIYEDDGLYKIAQAT